MDFDTVDDASIPRLLPVVDHECDEHQDLLDNIESRPDVSCDAIPVIPHPRKLHYYGGSTCVDQS